jgi:hypothetical protein
MSDEHMPSEARLKELLVGKKITEVRMTDDGPPEQYSVGPTGYLTLSDDSTLTVWGNDGGCACNAGCYPLAELNTCDNLIMNVEVEEERGSDHVPCRTCGEDYCYEDGHFTGDQGYFRIFIFAENQRINLASFEGSDGNGYYGTGWWLRVGKVEEPSG